MIIEMYAMKDELNGYTSPIPFMSEELAKRYLKDQVLSNPTVKNTPKDFSMWMIGAYDTETGMFKQEHENKLIERAENYV